MDTINLDTLHVRWHPNSPIPRAIYDGLLYGDSLDSLYQTLWTWAATDDKAAELKRKMLDLCTSKSWQPIQVVQEGTRFFIVSGELDALAAMHAGEKSIACTWRNGQAPATPLADEAARPLPAQAERPARPAPPPPDVTRALDHQIADFAGWLHARPQPSGHVLAASAAHLVAEIGKVLSPDEVWDLLFANRYSRMPTGWQPTPEQVHRAAVKYLAREAKTSEYTVNTLLKIAEQLTGLRDITPDWSMRKLEILLRLKGRERRQDLVMTLRKQRRPFTLRQLARLVSLCNHGLTVEEALNTLDRDTQTQGASSIVKQARSIIEILQRMARDKKTLSEEEMATLEELYRKIREILRIGNTKEALRKN